ncbi:MAG: hypothetical protein OEZ43_17610 [Gammaproteobacteria bacterium]|nr:hypothetical protein [Gammaproteobacteria bacterium]
MKRNDEEFVHGDRRLLKNWLILIFIYVLFLVWLEPIIDFFLTLRAPDMELGAIEKYNMQKTYIATVAFGVARSFPILLFMWFGYQVMLTSQLPPKGMRLPFTVRLIKEKNARNMGMLIIVVALILLFREFSLINQVYPVS